MRIAIIGIELSQLVCAHTILDKHSDAEVHLISERAEAGLIGELPGLITQPLSNVIPNEWIGDLGSQTPCLLYTSPSPRDVEESRMPSSA